MQVRVVSRLLLKLQERLAEREGSGGIAGCIQNVDFPISCLERQLEVRRRLLTIVSLQL